MAIIHSIINILTNSTRIIHMHMQNIINMDLNIMCISSSNLTNVTNSHSSDGLCCLANVRPEGIYYVNYLRDIFDNHYGRRTLRCLNLGSPKRHGPEVSGKRVSRFLRR